MASGEIQTAVQTVIESVVDEGSTSVAAATLNKQNTSSNEGSDSWVASIKDVPQGSAATKVFDTAELQEMILLYLDFKTLLFAQRINKCFHAMIQESSKLQKKLFLKPVSSVQEAQSLNMIENGKVITKLPRRILNTALLVDTTPDMLTFFAHERVFTGELRVQILPRVLSGNERHRSCENMYLCQPPAVAIKTIQTPYGHLYHTTWPARYKFSGSTCMTLRGLIDEWEKFLAGADGGDLNEWNGCRMKFLCYEKDPEQETLGDQAGGE